ncbi:MAG TPA: PQQ-binding-like beta-propeller repeat protein, partial [Vicinamibacterales bacterium]|nr:PQQ-binding-like beta-propeller repeat protein [Vicinamibacterales bacterium]
VWTVQCLGRGAPKDCGPDQDFGSPPMLVRAGRTDLLVAGQKSGNVWALKPDTGEIVWRTPLVADTTKFGAKIVWGGAADSSRAYFGLGTGGVAAVRLSDGARQWFTDLPPKPDRQAHAGDDGAVSVAGGVVFSGGWDGVVRALSASTGKVLWEFDTARDFETTNGAAAHGGSMGAAGPIVAGRRLFVPSGYIGVKNGMAGNVLLMFTAR